MGLPGLITFGKVPNLSKHLRLMPTALKSRKADELTAQPGRQQAAPPVRELLWGYHDGRIRELWATQQSVEEVRKVRDGERACVSFCLMAFCNFRKTLYH